MQWMNPDFEKQSEQILLIYDLRIPNARSKEPGARL